MKTETYTITQAADADAQVQRARFEALPERIPFEAMVAEQRVSPRNPVGDEYAAESSWRQAACFALDGI